jgi:anaerobic selenocysteine-containing dehydrogenase
MLDSRCAAFVRLSRVAITDNILTRRYVGKRPLEDHVTDLEVAPGSTPRPGGGADERAWYTTACILCERSCGVEIRVGDGRRTFERVRGDKAHPASKGYTCEEALRLDYYQNGRGERILNPLRRRPDGTFEE